MFEPLGHQKRCVFRSLGSYGSDGQVCRMIGPSWSSKMDQNCPRGLPFDASFSRFSIKQRHPEREVSQVTFILRFWWFFAKPDPRSARASAVENKLPTFAVSSATVVFSSRFCAHSWHFWHRNRSKRPSKSSLKETSGKVCVFLFCSRFW